MLTLVRNAAIMLGKRDGSLAQLVERFVYTEDVGSSNLSRPTIFAFLSLSCIKQMNFQASLAFVCRLSLAIGTGFFKIDRHQIASDYVCMRQTWAQRGMQSVVK